MNAVRGLRHVCLGRVGSFSQVCSPRPLRRPGCPTRQSQRWASALGSKESATRLEVAGITTKFDNTFLRDACSCPACVHPSTQQKLFQTTDIPRNITPESITTLSSGDVEIVWANDIPGSPSPHCSIYPVGFLREYSELRRTARARHDSRRQIMWNGKTMTNNILWIDYKDYMASDEALLASLKHLSTYGLMFLRGVPEIPENNAIEGIAERTGNIKDTFYGRTWDVKSVHNSTNIAYTSLNLGLHMDLLYFESPPGLQFLHCIKNTTTGGNSIFVDSFRAATAVRIESDALFRSLTTFPVSFRYRNNGQHYHFTRPTVVLDNYSYERRKPISHINWSPPFQAPFENHADSEFRSWLNAARSFADKLANPASQYEMKLKEGECVVFNNRRVLHARREFDPSSGDRWLKGTYVDMDAFHSTYRTLSERFPDSRSADEDDEYAYIQ